jgi:hypothetical protein
VLVDVAQAIGTHAGDMEAVAVEFEAEMRQVKSMADGTYNIVLNVPEYCLPQVQTMMGWLKDLVQVVMVKKA